MDVRRSIEEYKDNIYIHYDQSANELIDMINQCKTAFGVSDLSLRIAGELDFEVWITREETDIEYANRIADLAEKKQQQKLAKKKKEEKEKADYLRLKKKYGDKV